MTKASTDKKPTSIKDRFQKKKIKQQKPANDINTPQETTMLVIIGLSVIFAIIISVGVVFGGATGTGYLMSLISDVKLPNSKALTDKINTIHQTSVMTYSNGQKISDISSDLNRTKVTSENISPNVKHALIATEDENFEHHNGVVPKAFFRAILGESTGGANSGGSTITQQLRSEERRVG